MIGLLNLHKKIFRPMSAQETMQDREVEFNNLIESYELEPKGIAEYLILVRSTHKERKELIHKLIDDYSYAECLVTLADTLLELNKSKSK